MKKKRSISPSYFPSQEERKAMSWCINRGITIKPLYHSPSELKMIVRYKFGGEEKVMKSDEVFSYYDFSVKAYKGYSHYHQKFKDQNIPESKTEDDYVEPYFRNLYSPGFPEEWKKLDENEIYLSILKKNKDILS